jgi:hypothetical protein
MELKGMDLKMNMEEITEATKPTLAVEDRHPTVGHPCQTKEWPQKMLATAQTDDQLCYSCIIT